MNIPINQSSQKFRILTQRTLFGGDELVTKESRTKTQIIDAYSCEEKYQNLANKASKDQKSIDELGSDGGSLASVVFRDASGKKIKEIKVTSYDPYYKVLGENGNVLFKHNCSSRHCKHED
jgi:hypothetical protein